MHRSNHDTRLHVLHSMASIMLALLFWIGTPASGQSMPSQSTPAQTTPSQSMPSQDNDTKGWQIADMDKFLDSHPEIAEQLRKDPSLINNKQFVENHPALQEFLQSHPGVREEFSENPNAFMRREERFDRREGDRDDHRIAGDRDRNLAGDRDVTREELATTDRFLDTHPEIAEQLRKDPSLIKNKEFVENHPALQEFLQT